jgi:hypothetical protein
LLDGTLMGGALVEDVEVFIVDEAVRLVTLETRPLTEEVVGNLSTKAVVNVFDGVPDVRTGLMPEALRNLLLQDSRVPPPVRPTGRKPNPKRPKEGERGAFEFLARGVLQTLGLLPMDGKDDQMTAALAEARLRYHFQEPVNYSQVASFIHPFTDHETLATVHGWLLGTATLGLLPDERKAPGGRFDFVTKVLDKLTANAQRRTGQPLLTGLDSETLTEAIREVVPDLEVEPASAGQVAIYLEWLEADGKLAKPGTRQVPAKPDTRQVRLARWRAVAARLNQPATEQAFGEATHDALTEALEKANEIAYQAGLVEIILGADSELRRLQDDRVRAVAAAWLRGGRDLAEYYARQMAEWAEVGLKTGLAASGPQPTVPEFAEAGGSSASTEGANTPPREGESDEDVVMRDASDPD